AAITGSSWPLLGQMHRSGDFDSFRRNVKWLIGGCLLIIVAAFLFTAIVGDWALRLWLPSLDLREPGLLLAFAGYLSLYLWNTLWLAILCATGQISLAGRLSAAEAALGIALGLVLFGSHQSVGYLVGLMMGTLLTTSIFAPVAGLRSLSPSGRS
ncbi:MAG: hypothetical protein AB7V13_29290, partial [Pseudorhodoplanes sp.]